MLSPAGRAHLGLIAAGVVLCCSLGVLGMMGASRPVEEAALAPQFILPDTSGRFVSLRDSRGQITVLIFHAVRCPVSNQYAGRFASLAQRFHDDGRVKILGIESAARPRLLPGVDEIRVQRRVTGQDFPTLLDCRGEVARAFGVVATPTVVIVDAAGRIRYRGAFDDDASAAGGRRQYCLDALATLLSGRPCPMISTPVHGSAIARGN